MPLCENSQYGQNSTARLLGMTTPPSDRKPPSVAVSCLGVVGRSILLGEMPRSVNAGESGVRILSKSGSFSDTLATQSAGWADVLQSLVLSTSEVASTVASAVSAAGDAS